MKLTKAADVSPGSRIRTICLPPFEPTVTNYNTERSQFTKPEKRKPKPKPSPDTANKYLEKLNNITKNIFGSFKKHKNTKYNVRVSNEQSERKVDNVNRDIVYDSATLDSVVKLIKSRTDDRTTNYRNGKDLEGVTNDDLEPETESRNDKNNINRSDKKLMFGEEIDPFIDDNNGLDFKDECYTTGWGREQTNGTLTDVLLEAEVPILPLQLCRDKYSLSLPLNEGHLCAGSTDGSTGACVVSYDYFKDIPKINTTYAKMSQNDSKDLYFINFFNVAPTI